MHPPIISLFKKHSISIEGERERQKERIMPAQWRRGGGEGREREGERGGARELEGEVGEKRKETESVSVYASDSGRERVNEWERVRKSG